MVGILVIGEAVVDVVSRADGSATKHVGGSPLNVAIGLARLQQSVVLLSHLGDDPNGELLRRALCDEGVRQHPGAIDASATSVARARLGAGGDAEYEFTVSWDAPTSIDWDGVDVVHAGSIALALDPGAGSVLQLLRERADGVRVTVDPNVRPAFLPRGEAAQRLEPFFRLADLVKLSDEDAGYLYPGMSIDAVLDRLLELGASIAALTRGAQGAVMASRCDRLSMPALATVTADTVGAGDSFMSALIGAIVEAGDWSPDGPRLRQYLRIASGAAAITVSRDGSDPPNRADIAAAIGP